MTICGLAFNYICNSLPTCTAALRSVGQHAWHMQPQRGDISKTSLRLQSHFYTLQGTKNKRIDRCCIKQQDIHTSNNMEPPQVSEVCRLIERFHFSFRNMIFLNKKKLWYMHENT